MDNKHSIWDDNDIDEEGYEDDGVGVDDDDVVDDHCDH